MKVIYFDSWTQGVPYINAVNRAFSKYHVETKFVHAEKTIGKSLPENFHSMLCGELECEIEGIKAYDSHFYGKKIIDFILVERPDAVLMISLSHIENRIVTRYCNLNGIPVFYMMHGNLRTEKEDIDNLISIQSKANRFKLIKKLTKLTKYVGLVYQYYHASSSLKESLGVFYEVVSSPFSFLWNPKKHPSLLVDKAFVYQDKNIKSMVDFFKLDSRSVCVTGDPKADDFDKNIQKSRVETNLPSNYVLYLEQGLVDTGDITLDEQLMFINELSDNVLSMGKTLVVKLHPRANLALYESTGAVKFYKDEYSLNTFIYHSDFVVGHFSTALNAALHHAKPIFCASWFEDLRGTKFANHPCVFTCKKDFFSSMKVFKKINYSDLTVNLDWKPSELIVKEIILSVEKRYSIE